MNDLEWFARNLVIWPIDKLNANHGGQSTVYVFGWYGNGESHPDFVRKFHGDELGDPIERAQWERERYQITGKYPTDGNDGEHYDQAATVRDMNEPVIYTTATSLTVHYSDGHIDVTAVHAGGVVLVDQEGGETHIPSLAVLDAVRDAMARIVGE